eukprot:1144044-Pelagomonas_calceolata.AAC.5
MHMLQLCCTPLTNLKSSRTPKQGRSRVTWPCRSGCTSLTEAYPRTKCAHIIATVHSIVHGPTALFVLDCLATLQEPPGLSKKTISRLSSKTSTSANISDGQSLTAWVNRLFGTESSPLLHCLWQKQAQRCHAFPIPSKQLTDASSVFELGKQAIRWRDSHEAL